MNLIMEHLKECDRVCRKLNAHDSNDASFMLKYGREWTPAALPPLYKRGALGDCYLNAARLAMQHRALTYVEGYCTWIGPMEHAWCVTRTGRVVDPTWPASEHRSYFGIPFRTSFLARFIRDTGAYGLLDCCDLGFPIQTGKYPVSQWLKRF